MQVLRKGLRSGSVAKEGWDRETGRKISSNVVGRPDTVFYLLKDFSGERKSGKQLTKRSIHYASSNR